MNKDLRLSRVLVIVILAIIVILVSLNISELNLFLTLIPMPFALIGTLSNLRNNIISLIISILALVCFTNLTDALDIFINSIIPGMIIGILIKNVLRDKDSNKYGPIFTGSIIFIAAIILHYLLSKYLFKVDLLEGFIGIFNQSLESQKDLLQSTGSDTLNLNNITNILRNIIPSILFYRGIILALIIYFVEIAILKRMKYVDLSEIKFINFYLPGNAVTISFLLYIFVIILSYMKTPLYTDSIFLNLQMVFNFMFMIQGVAVSSYFIKKWIQEGINNKIFIGVICLGIFGISSISLIGMIDSVLDFRHVRVLRYR